MLSTLLSQLDIVSMIKQVGVFAVFAAGVMTAPYAFLMMRDLLHILGIGGSKWAGRQCNYSLTSDGKTIHSYWKFPAAKVWLMFICMLSGLGAIAKFVANVIIGDSNLLLVVMVFVPLLLRFLYVTVGGEMHWVPKSKLAQ